MANVRLFPSALRPLGSSPAPEPLRPLKVKLRDVDPPSTVPLREQLDDLLRSKDWPQAVAELQRSLTELERTRIGSADAQVVAHVLGQAYRLQQRGVGIANAVSRSENRAVHDQALELLQRIADLQSRGFERACALFDAKQVAPVSAWRVYRNTFKQPGYHSEDERTDYYLKKLEAFFAKGGRVEDIQPVNKASVQSLESGVPYEFAVDAYGFARMAPAAGVTPGHVVLAGGEDVLAAGTLVRFGEVFIVGTFSGHYLDEQPDLVHMKDALVRAGVAPDHVILQSGEAGSPRAVEVALSAASAPSDEAKAELQALIEDAGSFNDFLRPPGTKPKGKASPAAEERLRRQNLALFQLTESSQALDGRDPISVRRFLRAYTTAIDGGTPPGSAAEIQAAVGRLAALLDAEGGLSGDLQEEVELAIARFGSTATEVQASRAFGPRRDTSTRLGLSGGPVDAEQPSCVGFVLRASSAGAGALETKGTRVLLEVNAPQDLTSIASDPTRAPDFSGVAIRGNVEALAAARFALDRAGSEAALVWILDDASCLSELARTAHLAEGIIIDRRALARQIERTELPATEAAVLGAAHARGVPVALWTDVDTGQLGLSVSAIADTFAVARGGFDAVILREPRDIAIEQAAEVLESADASTLGEAVRSAAARIAAQGGEA